MYDCITVQFYTTCIAYLIEIIHYIHTYIYNLSFVLLGWLISYNVIRQGTYYERIIGARSRNHYCRGKDILHILSVNLWPKLSSMQCAYAILSPVPCPTLQYFSTLSHKQHDFRKINVIE